MKIVKKHPRYKAGPWIEAHRQDIQAFAEEHMPVETAKAFGLSERTLRKADFDFPLIERRRQFRLVAASLFFHAGAHITQIEEAVHIGKKALLEEGVVELQEPSVTPEKLIEANILMQQGLGITAAAKQLGLTPGTLRRNEANPDPERRQRKLNARLGAALLFVRLCGATQNEIVEHLHVAKQTIRRHDIRRRPSDKKGRTVFVRRGVLAVNEARL